MFDTDQGRNFEAGVIQGVCKYLGVRKTRTTGYNPKSDGLIERFNRTLMNIVSTMIDPVKCHKDWDDQLPLATMSYRTSVQESTGETPNMMMLGRDLALPIDVVTEQVWTEEDLENRDDYAEKLRIRMQLAHTGARECLKGAAVRQKRNYDRRAQASKLTEGTFAWLHNPAKKRGLSPKLRSPWEGPYLITHKLSDVIFRIQVKPKGKMLVVHADRLKLYEGNSKENWLKSEVNGNNRQEGKESSLPTPKEVTVRHNPKRRRQRPLRYT